MKFQVLFAFCAIIGTCLATIDSKLDEENFRKLKKESQDDGGDIDISVAGEDETKVADETEIKPNDSLFFWEEDGEILDEKAENLPYESLDEFDKLRSNPAFPEDSNDKTEDEPIREKREKNFGLFSNRFGNRKDNNKMNNLIRDTPEENSKFQGISILNDMENEDTE